MITNLSTVLKEAYENNYAVGAFNVYNYETIKAVIEVIKERKQDAIIAFGEKYLENMELKEVVNLIRTMTTNLSSKVVIHLDHCKDLKVIKNAIEAGFTSVMYDGSFLPYEENVANTKIVVQMAHEVGVSVEAELGSLKLGEHSNEDEAKEIYTDPQQAEDFVRRTGVDCLAVSIGTVHGMYHGEPKISVERLVEINQLVKIPLVLHGGSGTPVKTIKECIANGVAKINVNTEISYNVVEGFKEELKGKTHFSQLSVLAVEKAKEVVDKYMEIFNPKEEV